MEITISIDTNDPKAVALAYILIGELRPVETAQKHVETNEKVKNIKNTEPKTGITENEHASELTKGFTIEGADPGPSIALEDVRARVNPVIQAGKKAEVVQLLKKYGAAKVTEIAESDYAAFLFDLVSLA